MTRAAWLGSSSTRSTMQTAKVKLSALVCTQPCNCQHNQHHHRHLHHHHYRHHHHHHHHHHHIPSIAIFIAITRLTELERLCALQAIGFLENQITKAVRDKERHLVFLHTSMIVVTAAITWLFASALPSPWHQSAPPPTTTTSTRTATPQFIIFSGNRHMRHGGGTRDGARRLLVERSSKVSNGFVFYFDIDRIMSYTLFS